MNGWSLLLGAGALAAAGEYGIASYFFRRTMLRQNAATKRTMDMAGTNWDLYIPEIGKMKQWMLEQEREDVYIRSGDGLKLHGTYFPGQGSGKLVICFHGYTSKGMSDYIGLSNYYLPRGYQMLLVDERAHGDSEGTYIGFGCLDREDALLWITYAVKRFGCGCQIWLHGTSMGASTVLMASGLKLPPQVRGIVSDCAFTTCPCTEGPIPSAGLSDPETVRQHVQKEGRIRAEAVQCVRGSKESEGSHTLYPWGCGYFCSVQNVL